jgi:hypothetical protein
MKTTFLVEVESTLSITPSNVRKALLDFDPSVKDATVEFKGSVTTIPKARTFDDVRKSAELTANDAVNEYVAKYGLPMYCGVSYIYQKKALPLERGQRKVRYYEDIIRPTGIAGRTQSLDLQKLWCKTATQVFKDNGIVVYTKSWVD